MKETRLLIFFFVQQRLVKIWICVIMIGSAKVEWMGSVSKIYAQN